MKQDRAAGSTTICLILAAVYDIFIFEADSEYYALKFVEGAFDTMN